MCNNIDVNLHPPQLRSPPFLFFFEGWLNIYLDFPAREIIQNIGGSKTIDNESGSNQVCLISL